MTEPDIKTRIANAASKYRSNNISVIPISPRDKRPALKTWLPYQRTFPEYSTINQWFRSSNSNFNVGVVTGSISNLAIVDLDSEEAFYKLIKHAPWMKDEVIVRTGKGYHFWFKLWEYHPTVTFKLEGVTCHLKINGSYCVAPPSIHESGREYTFIDDKSDEWITRSTVDIEEIKVAIKNAGGVFSNELLQDKPIDWVSGLLRKIPPGERNDTAARLCGLLIKKHPYDPGLIKFIMESWNKEFCDPPLTDREIEYLVESEIARYLPKERRILETQPQFQQA